jgi:hypothetical protein
MRLRRRVGILLLGVLLAACAPVTSPYPSVATRAADAPITMADARECPVTIPDSDPAEIGNALFGSASAYGNDDLWVGGLGADGVIEADPSFVEADGSIRWKFGWYRVASGRLSITGRRLDAAVPPLRADVPDGYGDAGFQASGVLFPTEGCWAITGHLGGSELTFVTFVIRIQPTEG